MKLKYIEDYYEEVQKMFPDLEKWEIEKILKHGFQTFYMLNNKGADICVGSIKKRQFSVYFGKMFANKTLSIKYVTIKKRIKIRLKYILKNDIWNGYYYFSLTEDEYNKYIPEKKGRVKKKITFPELRVFKIEEENYLKYDAKYFFKVKMEEPIGFSKFLTNFSTRNFELYAIRDNGKIKYLYE